jgi:hypothetical protein
MKVASVVRISFSVPDAQIEPEIFTGGGAAADPERIYNLCVILKFVLKIKS